REAWVGIRRRAMESPAHLEVAIRQGERRIAEWAESIAAECHEGRDDLFIDARWREIIELLLDCGAEVSLMRDALESLVWYAGEVPEDYRDAQGPPLDGVRVSPIGDTDEVPSGDGAGAPPSARAEEIAEPEEAEAERGLWEYR